MFSVLQNSPLGRCPVHDPNNTGCKNQLQVKRRFSIFRLPLCLVYRNFLILLSLCLLFAACKPDPEPERDPIVNAETPVIISLTSGSGTWHTHVQTHATVTVVAADPEEGTLGYKWYQNESAANSGGAEISGQTDATLTLDRDDFTENGDYYFYVVVTNSIDDNGDGGKKTASVTSNYVQVTVDNDPTYVPVNAQTPNVVRTPNSSDWSPATWNMTINETFSRTVAANVADGGILTYQWYSNTTNNATTGTRTAIEGQTSDTLTLSRDDNISAGTHYFFAVVTNTNNAATNNKTATGNGPVLTLTVTVAVDAATPVVIPNIGTGTWASNIWDVAYNINLIRVIMASVTDGGTLSYQWYENTADSTIGGTPIPGQITETLSLNRDDYPGPGPYYFYAEVTNTNNLVSGNTTATAPGPVATVNVVGRRAQNPNITTQPVTGTWNLATTATLTRTVAANVIDSGTLTYQWYDNDEPSNEGGEPIPGSTGTTLSLARANYPVGEYYFYVVVTNTRTKTLEDVNVATTVSNVATVTVTVPENAQVPNIPTPPDDAIWDVSEAETFTRTVAASVTDGGTLSYQWYSNTSASNSGGTLIPTATTATLTLNRTAYTVDGDYYFYVVVTNTNTYATDDDTASVTSNIITISVDGN
ncbi:MAG: hypothetical protein FWG46_02745 [Treponema sp.]|nr:hypothetical protein [Treponema sp.]